MTRESIPRFDLYGELEVSRSATVEVIEAAYRALVKHHHPDVALPSDRERITRLNLAREWLTDPSRRWRYDVATDPDPHRRVAPRPTGSPTRPGGARSTGMTGPAHGRAPEDVRSEAEAGAGSSSFGVNSPEIRQFLADLRALDPSRAAEVIAGRDAADAALYAEARRAAIAASRTGRHNQWAFAREAAQVIARGKLGETPLAVEITSIVTDIAGAIAVRDLLIRAHFEALLLPWTWRPAPAPAPAGTQATEGMSPDRKQRRVLRPSLPRPKLPGLPSMPRPTMSRPSLQNVPRPSFRRPSLSRASLPNLPSMPSMPSMPSVAMPRLPRLPRRPKRPRVARPVRIHPAPPLTRVPSVRPSAMTLATSSPVLIAFVIVASVAGAYALISRPAPAPIIAVGGETATPTSGLGVSTTPSVQPTSPGEPVIEPAQRQALQKSAARTIRSLADAASSGNVAAAQAFLGDTALDLQRSGLRRATFPNVVATDIGVARDGTGFVATVGSDRLTSADGNAWTFDYGNRPLAVFGRSAERDLFWNEPNGRHDLFLRVMSATISKSGVAIRFGWRYRADRPSDPYYRDARLAISSITLGSRSLPLASTPVSTITPADRSTVLTVPGATAGADLILVQVTISPRPGAGGGTAVRPISTLLEVRPI